VIARPKPGLDTWPRAALGEPMKTVLRFECGASLTIEGPGTWAGHCRSLGSRPRRRDGRYRCVVYAGGEKHDRPRFADGSTPPCLGCPKAEESGVKIERTMERHLVVSCYPEATEEAEAR
jgi:hypothetical protein